MKHKMKITVLVVTLLASVALLNIGFAAFVFSNQAEKTYEANVSTEPVADRSCILEDVTEKTLGSNEQYIHFGVPKDYIKNDNEWFGSWKDSKTESLVYKRVFRVSKIITSIVITFSAVDGEDNESEMTATKRYKDAVDANLIIAPQCTVSDSRDGTGSDYFTCSSTEFTFNENSGKYSLVLNRNTDHDYDVSYESNDTTVIYVTISFGWGEHFNNENPYYYYNKVDRDDTIENGYTYSGQEENNNITVDMSGKPAKAHEDAFASLYKLNDFLKNLKYRLAFNGTANPQEG